MASDLLGQSDMLLDLNVAGFKNIDNIFEGLPEDETSMNITPTNTTDQLLHLDPVMPTEDAAYMQGENMLDLPVEWGDVLPHLNNPVDVLELDDDVMEALSSSSDVLTLSPPTTNPSSPLGSSLAPASSPTPATKKSKKAGACTATTTTTTTTHKKKTKRTAPVGTTSLATAGAGADEAHPATKRSKGTNNANNLLAGGAPSPLSNSGSVSDAGIPQVPTVEELLKQGFSKDEVKKHRRMLKNRQSASLSRRRKKEYLENLEEQNNALAEENARLKDLLTRQGGNSNSSEELKKQRLRLQQLETENATLRKQLAAATASKASGASGPGMKTGTALMMCMLCFALFSGIATPPSQRNSALAPHFAGRTLQGVTPAVVRPTRMLLEAAASKDDSETPSALSRPSAVVPVKKQRFSNETTILDDTEVEVYEDGSTSLERKSANQTSGDLDMITDMLSFSEDSSIMHSMANYKLSGGFPAFIKEMVSNTPKSSYVLCSECVFLKGSSPNELSLIMPSSTGDEEAAFVKLDCEVSSTQVLSA